jgi:hypothetical protein
MVMTKGRPAFRDRREGLADRQVANAARLVQFSPGYSGACSTYLIPHGAQQAAAPDVVRKHLEPLAGTLLETLRELR